MNLGQLQREGEGFRKVDKGFYDSFIALRNKSLQIITIEGFKLISMTVLLILASKSSDLSQNSLSLCFLVNAIASFVGGFYQFMLISKCYSNVGLFLLIAQVTRHQVNEVVYNLSSLDECTCHHIYVSESDIRTSDLDDRGKSKIRMGIKNMIEMVVGNSLSWARTLSRLTSILAIGTLVYSIVMLATTNDMNTIFYVALISYVVLVGLSQLFLIVVIILIVLFPLWIILFCCCMCCCREKGQGGQYINLESRNASANDVILSGGICPICRQGIDNSSRVYGLPCHQSHVFHAFCLNQWVKVKNTCPNCRAIIPTTSNARNSQLLEQAPEV